MTDTAIVPRRNGGQPETPAPLIDEQLADQLLGKAQAEGVELLGPDWLLSQVTKAVLERALAEEMTEHLGYEKHDPAGRGSGNSRNGMTSKTLRASLRPSRSISTDESQPHDRHDHLHRRSDAPAPGNQRDERGAPVMRLQRELAPRK
jgi:hypothetical protein